MAARLLFLICAGALLLPAEAQNPYDQLSDSYKKGVDLALEQLRSHSKVVHHFRFLGSVDKSEHDVSLFFYMISYFLFYLMKEFNSFMVLQQKKSCLN